MIIEYAGRADKWAGTGEVHEVRAWWNARTDSQGDVKRAASAAVRKEVGKGGSVAFESWDMSTYNHPQINAMIRVRVLTDQQVKHRKELKERVYKGCDGSGCKSAPGQVVRLVDGTEAALCFGCWNPLRGTGVKVLHYINKYGRIQL